MDFHYPLDPDLDVGQLVSGLLHEQPFGFLEVAARIVTSGGWSTLRLANHLSLSGSCTGASVGLALQWMLGPPAPRRVANMDVPEWLINLDLGLILQARRRKEGPQNVTSSYLLELELPHGAVGTLHGRIDHRRSRALTNVFVVDEPVDNVDRVLQSSAGGNYRQIQPRTAIRNLTRGAAQFDHADVPAVPGNPWPSVRPMFTFIMNNFTTPAECQPG